MEVLSPRKVKGNNIFLHFHLFMSENASEFIMMKLYRPSPIIDLEL